MSKRIRIKDVATLAGVSTATVSRALSTPESVGPATREKVMEAVKQTGYRINAAARDLRQRRSRSILILAPNLSNTFFSQIFAAVQDEASKAGLTVQISDSRIEGDRLVSLGHDGRADGIILLDGSLPAEVVNGWQVPLVQVSEWNDAYDAPRLGIDNRAATQLAVAHLLDLGHRAIAHVSGPAGNVLAETRRRAFLDAAAERGFDPLVFDADFTLAAGAQAARDWAALHTRPTAVFCASDECALGFMSQCAHLGVHVPRDVSVMGFDDIDFADHFVPSLTTIHQPRNKMGRAATRYLIERMTGADSAPSALDLTDPPIAPTLIERSSTRAVTG
ncbi:LacI family DNA-binding transcriptional regulator [Thalassorhabdomicrobium marinisediminis]|uniref:LacI family transcriptional regulator n=1 Tax=Thalassorhabdomicrobium marinisediminis TaxID=2170577 RepID=A0A2T7FTB6_9RHOB|nr:LacI family DNA-binding transcriptional regulator [Thalassorhabdomicrobium marinisediminis]PVA05411.1 LacI family transcriptional regulator [Thalassorhabdomicrobium marinisediminis]